MVKIIVEYYAPIGRVIIFEMRVKLLVGLLLLGIVIAAGAVVFALSSTPQLVEVYPSKGAENIPATTAIRLVFSRPMQPASVTDRLKIDPELPGSYSWDENVLTFTPLQAWPAGSPVNLALQGGARSVSWISFPMHGESWSFKTGEAMLAYLWPSDGPGDIFALTPVTGAIIRYTRGMGVLDYSLSENGIKLYFSAVNSAGGANLFRIDRSQVLVSSDQPYKVEELLNCGAAQCRNPVAGPEDKYLAYEYILPDPGGGLGPAQVWMMDLATRSTSPVGTESHETFQPSWSSEGLLAYYDRTSSEYELTDPASQEKTFLENQTGQPGDWSPDGQFYLAPEIFYYQAPENTERGTSHLLQYRSSDGTGTDITNSLVVEDAEAVYSPDGKEIAFARKFLDAAHWSLGRQIWIMNSDGSGAHPVLDEVDINHYDLAWSRDGKMLAYERFDENRAYDPPELWMINADGSDPVQLVIGGYAPEWIP